MKNIVFKGEIVFVRLLLPVIAGIVTAFYVTKGDWLGWLLIVTFWLFLVFILFFALYNSFKLYFKKWLPGITVHLLLYFLSLATTLFKTERISNDYFENFNAKAFVITVTSEPKLSNGILRFETEVNQVLTNNRFQKSCGKLLIALKVDPAEKSDLSYGDCLLIPNRISEIDPPFNPFEFNFKQYLSNLGIEKQAFINNNQIKILGREKGNPVVSYAYKLRQNLIKGFTRYISDKESAALASTLILGYKAELSSEIITAYSKTGTMHVLSVSGMHVLLVFSIFTLMLAFLDRNVSLKIVKVAIIITAVWFYALLTGFSSAVCRAAVMCSIFVIGKTFNRKTNSYNTLAASAVLLLLYNPYFLVDAGFQLSYLAVLGLIYLYPKIQQLFYFKNRIASTLWSWVAVSIAAQIATLPLSLYYFHQFPLYFLISNLFIMVPVDFIMYAGIAFLALYSLHQYIPEIVLVDLGEVLNFSIKWMNKGLIYIENLSYSSLSFYPYGILFYLCLSSAFLLLFIALQFKKQKALFLSLAMLSAITIYSSFEQVKRSDQRQIVFYSLRKSRAIGFFDREKAYLFSSLQPSEKTYTFSVQPSLNALAANVYPVKNTIKRGHLFTSNNFISFYGWKLMIWDKSFSKKHFTKTMKVNAVLLSDNPKVKLDLIKQSVNFSLLLIDATNKDYKIKQWENEARQLGLKYYILKRQQALKIDLKS